MSGFERWTNVGITGVSTSRLGPPWVIFGAAACLAMIFVAMVGYRSGVFRGALVAVGLVGLALLFLRTWLILTARTRRFLVARPDWDDNTRLAVFLVTYVAILLAGAVAGFILIVVMGALDRIAKGATDMTSLDANAPGIGLGFVLVGSIMWFLAYVNHDAGSGSIRAPDALRRLVRSGDGPVRLSSVALQVVALLVALTGLAVAAGLVPPSAILTILAPAAIVLLFVDATLSFRDRQR
jgi:hypothetical protein